jgi:hypothetical protein
MYSPTHPPVRTCVPGLGLIHTQRTLSAGGLTHTPTTHIAMQCSYNSVHGAIEVVIGPQGPRSALSKGAYVVVGFGLGRVITSEAAHLRTTDEPAFHY